MVAEHAQGEKSASEEGVQKTKKSSRVKGQDLLRAVLWLHELETSLKASPRLSSNKELKVLTRQAWHGVGRHVDAAKSSLDEIEILAKILLLMQPGNENILAVESLSYSVYIGGEDGKPSTLWLGEPAVLEASNKLCSCLLMHKGDKESKFSGSNSLYSEVSRRYAAAVEAALSTVDAKTLVKPPAGPRMLARCYVESLNAVSTLLKASKANNIVQETREGHNLALGAAISALGALGKAKLWAGPASHNAVLRAIGNRLSQVPRGAFELWLGGGNSNEFSAVQACLIAFGVHLPLPLPLPRGSTLAGRLSCAPRDISL